MTDTVNPCSSFVRLTLSSKTNESIPTIEAGCNLKVTCLLNKSSCNQSFHAYMQHMSVILNDNVSSCQRSCDIAQHQQEDKVTIHFTVYGYNPTVIKVSLFGDEISASAVLLKIDNMQKRFKERCNVLRHFVSEIWQ